MRALAIILFLATVPGLFLIKTGNDIKTFYRPDPLMVKGEMAMAEASGVGASGFTLTRAADIETALKAEEQKGIFGLSTLVPSEERQRRDFELKAGFEGEVPDYGKFNPVTIENVPFPVGAMRVETDNETILLAPGGNDFAPQTILTGMLNGFAQETYRLLAISLSVLVLILFCMRLTVLLVPVGMAVTSTLGLLGYLGEPVNFFQWLVFFVIIGLGMDYAIFHRSGKSNRTVTASFLTSLVGLGMLSFTSFQVTKTMGVTFAAGLFFAYFYSKHVVRAK